jgi:hypothetical protein
MSSPDRLHELPLPVTWELLGTMRRTVPPPLCDTLASIYDETVCRTVLCQALPLDGRPQRAVETWIRQFAPLRREWLEVAHEGVGDAGITPLRVEAIGVVRSALHRLRTVSPVRRDLEFALAAAGPILSAYAAARRARRPLDGVVLRRLSTRFDYCVMAALYGEMRAFGDELVFACPLLCSEARIAAAKLLRSIEAPAAPGRRAAAAGAGRRSDVPRPQ